MKKTYKQKYLESRAELLLLIEKYNHLYKRLENQKINTLSYQEWIREKTILIEKLERRNIKPMKTIPITKERLINLGFTREEYGEDESNVIKIGKKSFKVIYYADNDWEVLYEYDIGIGFGHLTSIQYVHELQDIIVVLTKLNK